MSLQQDILSADRRDGTGQWSKPTIVIQGAGGRGATVVASIALLAALLALAVPVSGPLIEALYPGSPLAVALNRENNEVRKLRDSVDTLTGRLAAQTLRIEAIETNLAANAERLGRVEARPQFDPTAALPGAETGGLKSDLGDIGARLSALEPTVAIAVKRIDALDTVGSNGKTFSGRVDGIESRVDDLGAALATIAAQQRGTADQVSGLPAKFEAVGTRIGAVEGQVSALDHRLDSIDVSSQVTNGGQRSLRLSVSLLQLNNQAQTHRPYSRDLATVVKLLRPAPDNPEIAVLSANAENGVATIAELRDSFSVIIAPKLRALANGSDRPVVDRMRMWVGSWIIPQNAPSAHSNPVDLVVDATIEKLAEDNVVGAISQLSSLDPNLAPLVSRWVTEAKNRVNIDRAMDTLLSLSVEDLARGPAGLPNERVSQ
jgi:hypothetical protein